MQDEASLSPAATRAGFSSAPRPQISIAHGIRSVTLGHDKRCQRRGNDPAAGGEKEFAITRERLCGNDHADKSEREGTFQRKYRMKRRTFKNQVALFRAALGRDCCRNSVLAVSQSLKVDLNL